MATRHTLPYYAPAERLPAPLPTAAEILAINLEGPDRIGHEWDTPLVRIGEYAVKYGRKWILQEGENMLFVKETTNVPVPEVYAIFYDEATGASFIVMEYIHGWSLNCVWNGLETDQKEDIASRIRRYMDELRSIPSPGYFGGIWRQPCQDLGFREVLAYEYEEAQVNTALLGPWDTVEQFSEALSLCVGRSRPKPLSAARAELLRRTNLDMLKKYQEPVFTHADLFQRNIMFRDDGTLVIIDWKTAGWFPAFWDYCTTIRNVGSRTDFHEYVPKMLDEYPKEGEGEWMKEFRGFTQNGGPAVVIPNKNPAQA